MIASMHFLVVGAGGVGAHLIQRLCQARAQVSVLARGTHGEALKRHGLRIVGRVCATVHPEVHEFPSEAKYDAVFLTPKLGDLAQALQGLRELSRDDNLFIPLQNGLAAPSIIEAQLPGANVVPGIAYIDAQIQSPGTVCITSEGRFSFPAWGWQKFESIFSFLAQAGIPCLRREDFLQAQWTKLAWNAIFNPLAVLTRSTVGEIKLDPHAQAMGKNLFLEMQAVAKPEGVSLPTSMLEKMFSIDDEAGSGFLDTRTSMWADYAAGKKTEVDFLNGEICKLGKRHGIATPHHAWVVDCIHALERSRISERKEN